MAYFAGLDVSVKETSVCVVLGLIKKRGDDSVARNGRLMEQAAFRFTNEGQEMPRFAILATEQKQFSDHLGKKPERIGRNSAP